MYAQANPYQTYHKSGVLTASPMELVVMLYDGAIKNLKLSQLHLEDKRMEKAHATLTKAQNILLELVHSLDMHYPLAQDLLKIYDYVLHETMQINIHKDPRGIPDLVGLLEELREAWKSVKAVGGPMYKANLKE